MTPEGFRRIALSQPGAEEGVHMGHPDFRVGGRVFATLGYPTAQFAVVMLPPIEQELFVTAHPAAFGPAAGGWGRMGSTTIRLSAARAPAVREAVATACRHRATRPRKPGRTRSNQGFSKTKRK